MQSRRIAGTEVSAIGLGAMQLSVRRDRPDEGAGIRAIHAALDAGVTLIDTADAYCLDDSEMGHNEHLVATALAAWPGDPDSVLVATKGGHTRPGGSWQVDGRPAYLRRACEASLKTLGVDTIGLYQYHRPDPRVPYAESVGALKELRDEGKVRLIGLSNANVEQIRECQGIVEIASVQNQLSPAFRSSEGELGYCTQQGIAFLPWSPLGGMGGAGRLGRRHAAFAEVAEQHGVSPQRACLAWLLAKSPVVIPIPGSSRPETILDSAAAADLKLSEEEFARLDRA